MRGFTIVFLSDLMETPARVNIKQPWQQVTSVTPRGLRLVCLKRSTVVRWCFGVPQRLIWTVDVLRYIALSHLWDSSSGTAFVRIRVVFSHYAVNTLEVQTCKCRNPLITNRLKCFLLMEAPERNDRADSSHAHANIITNGSSIRMQHNSQNDSSSNQRIYKVKDLKKFISIEFQRQRACEHVEEWLGDTGAAKQTWGRLDADYNILSLSSQRTMIKEQS